jgi:archaellum biogenesis protein FlaJ (TadC family)
MKTTLPKLDRCQQAMERTLVQGNPVFVFLINMNKTCVPFSLFVLCTLVHWHARVFIFFVAEKHDIFLSKQIGTPSGTWFSSHLCCAIMAVVFRLVSSPVCKWWSRWCYFGCLT